MSITREQAGDLILENYGDWTDDDPEWWDDMCELLMEFPSVKALRRDPDWEWLRIPRWWPGAVVEAEAATEGDDK